MISIQVIGKTPHGQLLEMLTSFFSLLGKVTTGETAPDLACKNNEKPHFEIRWAQHPQQPSKDREPSATVCLFADSCQLDANPFRGWNPDNTIAIVNAENTSVLKQLCNACLRTIPCGLSAHDTLTLTSSTEDSLVVSLQRSLTTFEGATVDPMEIPIPMERFRGLSRYLLMAFCALGCLTGQIQPLMQFLSSQKQPSDPSTDE